MAFGAAFGLPTIRSLMKWFTRTRPAESPAQDGTAGFLAELAVVAPIWNRQTYRFVTDDGACRGYVQFCPCEPGMVKIHRIWAEYPGHGNGSIMMNRLCTLADRHGVPILLKCVPFGKKPYPLSRPQLTEWYRRHGFEGTHRHMMRHPRPSAAL